MTWNKSLFKHFFKSRKWLSPVRHEKVLNKHRCGLAKHIKVYIDTMLINDLLSKQSGSLYIIIISEEEEEGTQATIELHLHEILRRFSMYNA